MALWLGTLAFIVIAILIALGIKQRRTLVPIFEKEQILRDFAAFPGYPFYWLEGPFLSGARYALALAMVALTPASMLEREQATFPCSKAEFMRHFSRSDVRRAVAFTLLGLLYLVLITLVYFLKPPEAA